MGIVVVMMMIDDDNDGCQRQLYVRVVKRIHVQW